MVNTQKNNYVWHDGIYINDDQLLSMALQAGSYQIAEHYLLSLLAHGLQLNIPTYIDKVNEVRTHYGVVPLSAPKNLTTQGTTSRHTPSFEQLRHQYRSMNNEQQKQLLAEALAAFWANHSSLFRRRCHWQGLYLVMKDRLDCGLAQSDFLVMAMEATPRSWAPQLTINSHVFKNMRHVFPYDNLDRAYYELDYNPQQALCNAFWEVVQQCLLQLT